METNNFENKTVQKGIILIIIFVILLLIVGIASHVLISFGINACGENELKELKHIILDGSSITFLTTIVMVLLVSVGIYFFKNVDIKLKEIEEANRNTEKLRKETVESIKNLNDKDTELEKLSSSFKLHIPIAYIYTTTSVWTEKKLKTAKDPLMSLFYKINRQISFINYELKTNAIKLDNNSKQMLTNDYLEDSITNIEKIVSNNKLNWEVAKKTLFDLKEIQKKIGSFEND